MLQVLFGIGEPEIGVRSNAVEAALAQGRKAHPLHPLARFLRTPAMWNHEAVRAEFESLHRAVIPVLADPNHQVHTCRPAGERKRIDFIDSVGAVLHIEPDQVIADAAHYFGEPWLGNPADSGGLDEISSA